MWPTGPPPVLDRGRAGVSLDRIVFDTFTGSSVRLSDATNEMIERLRDAIWSIYEPGYEDVTGGGWLNDRDLVLGYVGLDAEYAYPIKMLNFHELVNDVIDGIPVLVTYCPLCGSGIVFDRQLGGEVLVFGNTSALFENDLVMFDYETESYWFQTAA
jgi:hypothetical protein